MERFFAQGWLFAFVVAMLQVTLLNQFQNERWMMQQAAPEISANQILEHQSEASQDSVFVIVDVRSADESDVSIIPGAITVAQFEADKERLEGSKVICYCTVGYRSGEYANQLKAQGWDAFNYKGSILDWCNKELALETVDGRSTNQVHTYSWWYSVPTKYEVVY